MYIEVDNISKEIKGNQVLNSISLSMEKGHSYGFIGHNGSGKSMFLKALCGFIKTDEGSIVIDGQFIINGVNYIKNAGIIIEDPPFINKLTGYNNLSLLANIRGVIGDVEVKESLNKVGLVHAMDKKVHEYSLGMKQRLRIAQAIMEHPDILILDEPFNGLDKRGVEDIQLILQEYKTGGKTLLLTSHDERNIELLCDSVFEFEEGQLIK